MAAHVAVCPFPFPSHPGTALLLTRNMAARAADARFTFFITEKAAEIYSLTIGGSEGNIHFRRVDAGGDNVGDQALTQMEEMLMFLKGAGGSFRNSIDAAEKEVGIKFSCFVSEGFVSSFIGEIAEEKAAKWVAYWTAGATALSTHMYTDTLRSRLGEDVTKVDAETVDRYLPCFPPIYVSEIQKEVTRADLSSGPAQALYNMSLMLPKAAATAVNSCRALEISVIAAVNREKFADKLLCLGPFPLTMHASSKTVDQGDKHGCLSWLDTQLRDSGPSTVAYVSFGTAVFPSAEEHIALAKALECTGVPFLWALPEAYNMSIPKGFYERATTSGRGKIVKWAPQTRVLQHEAVGVFVTHCGWKSVVESICARVPMVCRPFRFAEQMINKGLVERVWRIGVGVEGGILTDDEVTKAIKTVLLGEEGGQMRERITVLKKLVEEGAHGSSTADFKKWMDIVVGPSTGHTKATMITLRDNKSH